MRITSGWMIGVLVWMGAGAAAAQFDYSADFTYVRFGQLFSEGAGAINLSTGQVFSGIAEQSAEYDAEVDYVSLPGIVPDPGTSEAYGFASKSTLRARASITGRSVVSQVVDARNYEIYTILDPMVPVGTPGSGTWYFEFDGGGFYDPSSAAPVSNDVVTLMSMEAIAYPNLSEQGRVFLDFDIVRFLQGDVLAFVTHVLAVEVDFLYGIPFGLENRLSVRAVSDWNCSLLIGNPNRIVCGGGTVNRVTTNAVNTASLESIILPAGASVSGTSGTDYSSFVGAPIPVPEPATGWLLSCGLGALAVVGLRRGLGANRAHES